MRCSPMPDLLLPSQAAARLRISVKHLRVLVRSGALRYVDVSRPGAKLSRMRFIERDLDELIEHRTKRDPLCPSTNPKTRRTTNMTSTSEIIGFTARRNARAAEKRKR